MQRYKKLKKLILKAEKAKTIEEEIMCTDEIFNEIFNEIFGKNFAQKKECYVIDQKKIIVPRILAKRKYKKIIKYEGVVKFKNGIATFSYDIELITKEEKKVIMLYFFVNLKDFVYGWNVPEALTVGTSLSNKGLVFEYTEDYFDFFYDGIRKHADPNK